MTTATLLRRAGAPGRVKRVAIATPTTSGSVRKRTGSRRWRQVVTVAETATTTTTSTKTVAGTAPEIVRDLVRSIGSISPIQSPQSEEVETAGSWRPGTTTTMSRYETARPPA